MQIINPNSFNKTSNINCAVAIINVLDFSGTAGMMVLTSIHAPTFDLIPLKVGDHQIPPAVKLRNLGVIMDKHLTMSPHIQNTVRNAFFKIREISYYRRFLTSSATKSLIHAYVTSRLDYCNGLLYGLPKVLTNKLQSVLNTAARLVTLKRKYDSITPDMQKLHWLPIESRIKYKIILQVFKSLNGMAPKYLADKLKYSHGLSSYDKTTDGT